MHDPACAVLEGRRKWKRSRVDFVKFLIGVIQSLSSHIVEGKPLDAFDDVVAYEAPDEDTDALDRRPSPAAPTPARTKPGSLSLAGRVLFPIVALLFSCAA